MAEIVFIEGPHAGRTVPLSARSIVLGRDPDVDVMLDDQAASGRHAEIRAQEGVNLEVVIGDGGWGRFNVRRPVGDRWYLAKTLRRRHVWSVELSGDEVHYTALGAAGQVFDEALQPVGPR